MALLDDGERWVTEQEPIFMRGGLYYFFERGWSEAGPFNSFDDCLMSLEAYWETSEYL
jgi:hypothetical protein